MKIRFAAIVFPFLILGCVEHETATTGKTSADASKYELNPDPNRPPIGCKIQCEPICELGKAPRIVISLINQTDSDINLVGSLDASDCKWRYPHCYFEVTGPDGNSPVLGLGRCGNMNSLRVKDFVNLPPGEAFNPYQTMDGYGFFSAHQVNPATFRIPGAYRIQFVYSTECNQIEEWGGDGRQLVAKDQQLLEKFRLIPKVTVKSEIVTVTVVEPGK